MKFTVTDKTYESSQADLYIVIYETTANLKKHFSKSTLANPINELIKSKEISSTSASSTFYHDFSKKKAQRVCFVGFGKKQVTAHLIREKAAQIAKKISQLNFKNIVIDFKQLTQLDVADCAVAFTEGFILGNYTFSDLKTDKKATPSIQQISFISTDKSIVKKTTLAAINADAQNVARYLANLPGNLLTPSLFVKQIKSILSDKAFKIKVFNSTEIQKKGMNALYNVGKGSENPPYLVEIKLNVTKTKQPAILVGKGVTFDAGGISLKPSKGMGDMKADMSGAAAVVGALKALSDQKASASVIGLIPLAENMPSGSAYRPGDVITSYSGKSIEITNTDAEGRLIMADALAYATEYKPKVIIDIATLTGAACVALGELSAALFGNQQKTIDSFLSYVDQTGEQFWQLPLFDDYLNYLKSDSADLINASESRTSGGAITAAKFLEQFVDKCNWLHLDIAPMMQVNKATSYLSNGMTGFSTRTLVHFLRDLK